jgi:hypothetical protein
MRHRGDENGELVEKRYFTFIAISLSSRAARDLQFLELQHVPKGDAHQELV